MNSGDYSSIKTAGLAGGSDSDFVMSEMLVREYDDIFGLLSKARYVVYTTNYSHCNDSTQKKLIPTSNS